MTLTDGRRFVVVVVVVVVVERLFGRDDVQEGRALGAEGPLRAERA